jgi:bifunctional DNA-binding transcriptional regulator/antitoxin component of YhaV-PrlF toxin-antitoxin module
MTVNTDTIILKIGSKGEIFPPKIIREKLGFEPNQPILLYIHQDQLIIRKIHSIEEILNVPPKTKISYHVWKQFKEDLIEEYES